MQDQATPYPEIEAMMGALEQDPARAQPVVEHALLEQIRAALEDTRAERLDASSAAAESAQAATTATAAQAATAATAAAAAWRGLLPYAAQLCARLARLEPGWEDELAYFAAENAQFWLDDASAALERGDIRAVKAALGQVGPAARLLKEERILQVEILLGALDVAIEISDGKAATALYEEAEKVYRAHLAGGDAYTGSGWLPKIKKMGERLAQFRDKLRRYYQYAESVAMWVEASSERDLERALEALQLQMGDQMKVTRRAKATAGGYRARVKLRLGD